MPVTAWLTTFIQSNGFSTSWIKDREGQEEEIGKDRDEARTKDNSAKDNTIPDQDQVDQKAQQLEAEENQLAFEEAQVMQEMERKNEE